MSPSTTVTPEIEAEIADGAMSVAQACEFTGDGRSRLFELMDAGVLEWFLSGTHRRITRASLRRYLATLMAQHKTAPVRVQTPKRKKSGQGLRSRWRLPLCCSA